MYIIAKLFVFLAVATWCWAWTLISNIGNSELVIFIASITSIMVWLALLCAFSNNKLEFEVYCFMAIFIIYMYAFSCMFISSFNYGILQYSALQLYLLTSVVAGLFCNFNIYIANQTINNLEIENGGLPNARLVYKPGVYELVS